MQFTRRLTGCAFCPEAADLSLIFKSEKVRKSFDFRTFCGFQRKSVI